MSPDDFNKLLSYLLSGLATCFAVPFFYIVIYKSPPALHVYRNTILNLAFWYCSVVGVYTVLFQPVHTTLLNRSCARFIGLVSHFGAGLNVAVMFLTVISLENVVVAVFICFFYRYDQMKGINQDSFMDSYKGTLICVALHIAASMFASALTYAFLVFGEIIEDNGTILLCASVNDYHAVKIFSALVALLFISQSVVIVTLAVITIKRLSSQKTLMTKRTYRLQQLLTTNLVVLITLPLVFDVIPICILCFMIYIKADSLYFWVSFTGHAPFADLIFTFVATLLFVTPYREAVRKMLWKKEAVAIVHSIHSLAAPPQYSAIHRPDIATS
ncbi:hypothetical protein QR680_015273 [Steinernema hermaphroditum]|uniref:Uncharacterized protein n=1 Tax=Steinernema hermaphroditum TaxID=289476 RepID=A0AA39H914_9BILA|nr:hypothetical protein QR680_015273 [Steinernema hermaphroditum]